MSAEAGTRIGALDLLRGIAILGTLGTNIWIFTNPGGIVGFFAEWPRVGTLGDTMTVLARYLANGKFLGLLTLLFGVGVELQYRSARRRGARWPGWYLWRAGLLLCEGALHYLLVFEGDVLMAYALTSFVVAYLVARSERAIKVIMIALGALQVLVLSAVTGLLVATVGWRGGTDALLTPPGDPALFSAGSYLDQVVARWDLAWAYRSEAIIVVPSSVVLFLLGAWLTRAGVFDRSPAGRALRKRLMLVGLGFGAPLNLATSLGGPVWSLADRYLLPPLVAVGLLGLVTTLALRAPGAPGRCRRGLEAVGRTAMSCYVFQNVVASALCYGWGLGLAQRWADYRPWWTLAAWLIICLAFTVLASCWLRRFDRGPLELAMHWAYQAPIRWSGRADRRVGVA